ncbi:MAG: hypothetical protein HYX82_02185 [Chloroflexi bacterium]|nr:hypothetical protein [Chloroflexota bacterium]
MKKLLTSHRSHTTGYRVDLVMAAVVFAISLAFLLVGLFVARGWWTTPWKFGGLILVSWGIGGIWWGMGLLGSLVLKRMRGVVNNGITGLERRRKNHERE